MPRVCVIGLDCLTPQLVFDTFAGSLPNLEALASAGMAGPLESCIPPITVPAWTTMVTSADPGMLGCYGFRDRADHSYDRRRLASSMTYNGVPIWTLLSRAGLRCRVLGVPQTYPPKPVKGSMVTGMLTPDTDTDVEFTYPAAMAGDVKALCGGYRFDVDEFRTGDKDRVLRDIHAVTAQHFRLARAWVAEKDWDLFMMVELGPDRVHHAFWRYAAADHPAHQPGHRFAPAIRDYYVELDREVGTLIALLDEDDVVMVVSDHGAQTLHGCIAVNQWLVERGDLVLTTGVGQPVPFSPDLVDWSKTRAWADGGYVGRIYFNVEGREPGGIVAESRVDALARELRSGLLVITRPDGTAMQTRVHRPREIYREQNGVPPDLTILFDDLAFRAIGSVGHPSIHVPRNDTGPDDANHARHGVLILRDERGKRALPMRASLYDIAPTILGRLGVAIPDRMIGEELA
ncbi:MAG: alkaline phosphatase family protein [Myxococcota bacterium]